MTAALVASDAIAAGTSGTATRTLTLPSSIPDDSKIVLCSGQSTGSSTASLSGLVSSPTLVAGPEYMASQIAMCVWIGDVGPADESADVTVTWTTSGKCISLAYAILSGVATPVVGVLNKVTGSSGSGGAVADQGSVCIEMVCSRAASETVGPTITMGSPFDFGIGAVSHITGTGVQGSVYLADAIGSAAGSTVSTSPAAGQYIAAAVSFAEASAGNALTVYPVDVAGSTDTNVVDQAVVRDDSAGSADTAIIDKGIRSSPTDSAGSVDSTTVVLTNRRTIIDSAGSTDGVSTVKTGLTSLLPLDNTGSRDSVVFTRAIGVSDSAGSRDPVDVDLDRYIQFEPRVLWEPIPPAKWRYLVLRLDGSGGQTWLDLDLPLTSDPSLTTALTGAGSLTATVEAQYVDKLAGDGRPLLEPWSTCVFAEASGVIRGGGILSEVTWDRVAETASITCVGISGYMFDMTYTDSQYWVQVDPLDVFRHAWAHMQSKWRGNLGVTIDPTTSPVRIGTEVEQVEFTTGTGEQVSFEAGPYKLTWWKTDDIGAEMVKLAEVTPFDWRETATWSADHRTLLFHIELGFPRLGGRRHDLRFATGENITVKPAEANLGEDYSDEVTVVGAGDGAAAQHGWAARSAEVRLRRATTLVDRTLESIRASNASAAAALTLRAGIPDIESIEVVDSRNAPLGSWQDGDDILVQLDTWSDWFRVTSTTFTPNTDTATLTLRRVSGVR